MDMVQVLYLPRPFCGKWWAWFKSFTHATPFLWCQSMQQEKYFKWSLLLLFLSYLFLHDYRLLLLSVLDKKYAKIFHEELLLWRRKKTKIIHENDAIQSENSPMLFIQKIILSQEWYDVCNYYHYYSISWKYTRISVCNISVVLCHSI